MAEFADLYSDSSDDTNTTDILQNATRLDFDSDKWFI